MILIKDSLSTELYHKLDNKLSNQIWAISTNTQSQLNSIIYRKIAAQLEIQFENQIRHRLNLNNS